MEGQGFYCDFIVIKGNSLETPAQPIRWDLRAFDLEYTVSQCQQKEKKAFTVLQLSQVPLLQTQGTIQNAVVIGTTLN